MTFPPTYFCPPGVFNRYLVMKRDGQTELFEVAATMPEGLAYRDGVLSSAEEAELTAHLTNLEVRPFQFRGVEARRRVVYFGWRYDFAGQRLQAAEPMPDFLLPLRERAADLAGIAPETFSHLLINEYAAGTPIGWHRDRAVFDDVVGVSLGAPCGLRFRRLAGVGWERLSVPLSPRSAYLLRGAARNEWEHSIAPVRDLRYSITFRSLNIPIGP